MTTKKFCQVTTKMATIDGGEGACGGKQFRFALSSAKAESDGKQRTLCRLRDF